MIRLVLDRDGKKLEALKSIRKQLQVAWVKDDSCLKRGMWLLNRHLLLNDCVCVYIYTQIHFTYCSRIGPFQWHLLISSPPTHSELLSHLLLAPQRLHPRDLLFLLESSQFPTKWNLFCILGHSLLTKTFVGPAVISSLFLKSSFTCWHQPNNSGWHQHESCDVSVTHNSSSRALMCLCTWVLMHI